MAGHSIIAREGNAPLETRILIKVAASDEFGVLSTVFGTQRRAEVRAFALPEATGERLVTLAVWTARLRIVAARTAPIGVSTDLVRRAIVG